MSQLRSAAEIKAGNDPSAGVFAKIGIAVLLLSYGINAMDRALFPMMLTDVRREYAFTLPQAGLMSTVFTLGMALAGLPTGYLMSRYSRKAVVQIGIFIFSVATIVTVVSAGFLDMLFYRAVTGIGEAMQLTALLAVFSSYLARHRGVGVGAVNGTYGIGAIIGPALGAHMLVNYGTWRAPMIAFGLIGLICIGVVAAFVRPWLSEVNRAGANGEEALAGGAGTLRNWNTAVLLFLSVMAGLATQSKSLAGAFAEMARQIVKDVIKMAIIQIKANAGIAGSEAASSQAMIPFAGPFLAIGAMALVEGAVLGLLSLVPSASGGWDIPKGINPIAQVHSGEMILPEKYADVIRGIGGAGGGLGGDIHVHVHSVYADADSLQRLPQDPQFIRGMREAQRNGRL